MSFVVMVLQKKKKIIYEDNRVIYMNGSEEAGHLNEQDGTNGLFK